ncbi:unnamed protein product [Rhizoctonia solani]|uniref:Uncharacterized protein n=1 Tax=Rhizoctonia solani TaxID=456999 RepID=A0A8H2X6Q1_9AGAM|nr:unnamed protein product [Rhizoctonia solani]
MCDASLILQGLSRVRNVNPDHIIPRTSQLIDVALDKFFDPTDISEGAMLILIEEYQVSCHGLQGYGSNVLLQFKTQDGTIVDSRMLQDKIMALPKHCTLEVVVDTCIAENVIPGLRRISTMDPSAPCSMPAGVPNFVTAHTPPSGSRLNTMVSASSSASSSAEPSASFPTTKLTKYASAFFEQDQLTYKAQVIVWAASTGSGKSFTEEHLPDKPGVYSILVGAIFNRLSSNGPAISRRSVWENVLKVVEQHNDARCERDLYDPDRVLNGLMFQPL